MRRNDRCLRLVAQWWRDKLSVVSFVDADCALDPQSVVAVVLTHRRPELATATVRSLLDEEGFTPQRVVLVIDRDGGLTDERLHAQLRVVRLTENRGPAAGFRAGLELAFADPLVRWVYLVEDDAVLLGVPTPRIPRVLDAVAAQSKPVGAVVVEGRRFIGRGDKTAIVAADPHGARLQPIEVAAWGMTLVARPVVDAGILPDETYFFGYEDFDFFLRMRAAGFSTVVDRDAAVAVAVARPAPSGRSNSNADEPWRAYYATRNAFPIIRRYGRPTWYVWHLLYTLRRAQLAGGAGRRAIAHGLVDGLRGRTGRHPGYVRGSGNSTGPTGAGHAGCDSANAEASGTSEPPR